MKWYFLGIILGYFSFIYFALKWSSPPPHFVSFLYSNIKLSQNLKLFGSLLFEFSDHKHTQTEEYAHKSSKCQGSGVIGSEDINNSKFVYLSILTYLQTHESTGFRGVDIFKFLILWNKYHLYLDEYFQFLLNYELGNCTFLERIKMEWFLFLSLLQILELIPPNLARLCDYCLPVKMYKLFVFKCSYTLCNLKRSLPVKKKSIFFNWIDDGGRWNIVDNTYNGNAWSRFTNKHSYLYI